MITLHKVSSPSPIVLIGDIFNAKHHEAEGKTQTECDLFKFD